MAFDISTAKPVESTKRAGFDISTAKPMPKEGNVEVPIDPKIEKPADQRTLDDAFLSLPGAPLLAEFAAGANRSIADIIDFFGPGAVNAALQVAGSDYRIPTARQVLHAIAPSERGEFAQGLSGEAAATAGELAPAATGVGTGLRGIVKQLGPETVGESVTAGVTRRLGASTPEQDITAAIASGVGQEVGEDIGGDTGALVGGIAAPLGGAFATQGLRNLFTQKFGKNITLIDASTGLPTKEFQAALDKKGISFGSLVDDIDNLPAVSGANTADEVVDDIIKQKIKSGSKDDALATYILQSGNVVSDELGEEAIKQGFAPRDVSFAKNTTRPTKDQMLKMLQIKRQTIANSSTTTRPTDIAGKHVMDRFQFIKGRAQKLRGQLDGIAGSNLKGKQISTDQVQDKVFDELERIGVTATGVPPNLSFVGSDISKDRTSQKVIKDVIDLLAEEGSDALRAHKLKRQLDAMIDFRKKSEGGLTETGRNFAKSIRHELNQVIRDVDSQYAAVNDELSSALTAMNGLVDALPRRVDVYAENANAAVGQDLRKLLSNYSSRQDLRNAIEVLSDTAKNLGDDFDVDVNSLVVFANALDDRFSATAKGSFKGQIESAIKASRGREGVRQVVEEKAEEKLRSVRGISDENAFNVMQRILMRN